MSAPQDASARTEALSRDLSFIVKAPAGSGKTGLLVRRYVALLATVDEPEEVLAITFTRKATAEMRARVIEALELGSGPAPDSPHERELWGLARELLQRNDARGWNLAAAPSRLAIQTIDALASSLARRLPWLSGLGGALAAQDNNDDLYQLAARYVLDGISSGDARLSRDVAVLLRHLDGDRARAEALIASMLAKREQWLDLLPADAQADGWRSQLEQTARLLVQNVIAKLHALLSRKQRSELARLAAYAAANLEAAGTSSPVLAWLDADGFPAPDVSQINLWRGLGELLLTKSNALRKDVKVGDGFPPKSAGDVAGERKSGMVRLLAELRESKALTSALTAAKQLPDPVYSDAQWRALDVLRTLLTRAAAELRVQFALERRTDFTELTLGACHALGRELEPSDLALALDRRIRHVLVDEFQDTSWSHARLVSRLVGGFDGSDGRTLFVVGDPMQSIYRFRQADVRLFLELWDDGGEGLAGFPVAPLQLTANFRSRPAIVEWVNRTFAQVLPVEDDAFYGAAAFAPAKAGREDDPSAGVHVHALIDASAEAEADEVERAVAAVRDVRPEASIAVLGRARSHLTAIVRRLREQGHAVRGSDLEPLAGAQAVRDLVALARTIAHPADRISLLAVLRAPWCGLTLADLHALAADDPDGVLLEVLLDTASLDRALERGSLSRDGHERARRVADVLREALEVRGRATHGARVRKAWLALGGPACAEGVSRADIELVFGCLRRFDDGAAGARFDELDVELGRLFVRDEAAGAGVVDVMTMHKAKGLEFDVVILPGLHRTPRADDTPLLAWTRIDNRDPRLVIAPVPRYDGDGEPLFRCVRQFESQRSSAEAARLLYVACTRARESLHLIASAGVAEKQGERALKQPARGALLHYLWPAVKEDFKGAFEAAAEGGASDAVAPAAAPAEYALRRLPRAYLAPETAPLPVSPEFDAFEAEDEPVEYVWARREARHVGTTVHAWLQRIAQEGIDAWNSGRIAALAGVLSAELRERGVTGGALERALAQAIAAIERTLADERGRWILDPAHAHAANELTLTGELDGEIHSIAIDRTFVEQTSAGEIRWIVDYKTGAHTGGDLDSFLDREQARYRTQLERYARIMRAMDARPIRVALYFPMMQGWRAWRPNGLASTPD